MNSKIYIEPAASERKYRRLAAMGRELGVPIPQVFIEFEVTMPDGRVIHHHKQRAHSWVRNAYNMMFSELAAVNALDSVFGAGKVNIKNTGGGVSYNVGYPIGLATQNDQRSGGYGYIGSAATYYQGIEVGYDTATAENFEQYTIVSPILEGTTNDGHHLNYIVSQAVVISYDAGSKTLSAAYTRYMNNNSGGNVIVGESALMIGGMVSAANLTWLNGRDHLGSPITIPNTGQLKVTYTISLVYPA